MNLKQLTYFMAAAEQHNITGAAKKLHMAQPPLSRQLTLLEEELGVTLFKRSNKGIDLTPAGQMLYDKSAKLFKDVGEMVEMVRETDSGVRGTITIGTFFSDVPFFIDKMLYIRQHYPLIHFKIHHGTPVDLVDALEKNEVDLLFMRTPTCDLRGFHSVLLEADPLELVMHRDLDPAPDQSEIDILALKDLPLCTLRSGKHWGYNEYLVNECERHGFTPNIVCQCTDTSIVMQLVQLKMGLSYQPRSIVSTLNIPDVYSKPIKNFDMKTYPSLIWNNNIYLSRSVKLFLSLFDIKTPDMQNPEE
ncbi:MAG: LysR family transcriptional regulator [Firmicutes bacterium]|nr:LysR family transcriptional regulator [Bacillota bacterium]